MNKEHKTCPFCNGEYLYVIGIGEGDDTQEKIFCADCGATGPFADSKEEAWEKWDKRREHIKDENHN